MYNPYIEEVELGTLDIELTYKEKIIIRDIYTIWKEELSVNDEILKIIKSNDDLKIKSINKLIKLGYLNNEEKEGYKLTTLGKIKGEEYIKIINNIAGFLNKFPNVNKDDAEEAAYKIEHFCQRNIVEGFGKILSHEYSEDIVIDKDNILLKYKQGEYYFQMGIYRADLRYPREYAKEFDYFNEEVILVISSCYKYFLLERCSMAFNKKLWYKVNENWICSELKGNRYKIPSNVFKYSTNIDESIIEADIIIAFTNDEKIKKKDIREINIHLW